MMTEKDIRKFMRANRIPVPKDVRFMSELVRQIDLLPTPAAFTDEEKLLKQNRLLVDAIRTYLRRYLRRKAIATLFVNAIFCLIVLLTVFLAISGASGPSPVLNFIEEWYYMIIGALGLCSLAISLHLAL